MNHNTSLYPLKFKPIYKEKIWGNGQIRTLLDRDLCADTRVGESWELTDREGNRSVISNGSLSGKTIHEAMSMWGEMLLGKRVSALNNFPLLIKYLDINDVLSVQVHPDERYVEKFQLNDSAKNEFWYIWETSENASIKCGFTMPVTKKQFLRSLEEKELGDLLKTYHTHPGEGYHIEAGIVHAPQSGNLIIEVQQNSDTTFRLYDWDRPGLDNKPRELHVKEGLQAINWEKNNKSVRVITKEENKKKCFVSSEYFTIEEITCSKLLDYVRKTTSFEILIITQGAGVLASDSFSETFRKGDLFLVPALLSSLKIEPQQSTTMLSIYY